MTTQTEALKMALEALQTLHDENMDYLTRNKLGGENNQCMVFAREAITTIKEALAQQEGQSNYCLQCEALSRELAALKTQQSNEQSKCNHTKTITRADIDGNQIETTCGECGERVAQQSNEQVEPVAWRGLHPEDYYFYYDEYPKELDERAIKSMQLTPLYTHPPVPTAQPKKDKVK